MADNTNAESRDAEWLFPDTVAAAYARGSQAMSTQTATFPALTEPAPTFHPAAFDAAAFRVPE
jgi:hypothetical protein